MHSPFHTEAPEKVREVPAVAPAKAHHGEGPRGILLSILFFALIALLVWGCYQVYSHPFSHYPYATVDRGEAQQPADDPAADSSSSDSSASQTTLQPVTILAENTGASGTDVAGWDTVVARFGDHELINRDYIYYYWDSFYNLYSAYGSSMYNFLSITVPFDQQQMDDAHNWNQYLGSMSIYTWQQTELLCEAAEAAGFTLTDEDENYLQGSVDSLTSYAAENGYASPEEYLQVLFDPCADVESYIAYNRDIMLASSYADHLYQTFYDDNFDPDAEVTYCVNVRHILLKAEDAASAASMASAKARAEELYAQWQQDPTEANFETMAEAYTEDPGSKDTGGLYMDIYPGQMVTNFNDWCFDESRQPGDHGIVETEYGYHIMYFVGDSETVYSDENELVAQQLYTEKLNEIFDVDAPVDLSANAVFTEKPEKPAAE